MLPLRLLAATLTVTAGCETGPELDLPRPEPRWHGEHLSIAVEGVDVCEGSFEAMDRNVELLSTMFASPDEIHLTAYLLSSEELFENGTCHAAGCTWRSEVWSLSPPASHELAHAVRGRVVGWEELVDTPPVLEEGLAEVFGDARSDPPEPSSIEEVIDAETDGIPFGLAGYQRAGHFVRYLVERYSLGEILALSRRAAKLSLEQAFEETTGDSLDDILSDYATYPWCSRNNWRMPLLECSGEPLAWTTTAPRAMSVTFELACDETTIGPRMGRVYRTETIEVSEPGPFVFAGDFDIFDPGLSPDDYSVRLVRCDASCVEPFEVELEKAVGASAEVELEPGRYYLEFDRDVDADDLAPFTVRLEEQPG